MGTILDDFYDDLPCSNYQERLAANEKVNHPLHYGGKENPYEAIKVIESWDLGFNLGNVVKYVSRAGKKDRLREIEDLEKAKWYLDRQIEKIKNAGIRP